MVATLQHWNALSPPNLTMAASSAVIAMVHIPDSVAKKYPVS